MSANSSNERGSFARPAIAQGEGIAAFFTPADLERLTERMSMHRYESGNHLFWEGDAASYHYLIVSGRIKLTRMMSDGKSLTLSFAGHGDFLGEYGGEGELMHGMSAEATEEVVAGLIASDELELLLNTNGSMAVSFAKWLGIMQQISQSKLRDLTQFGKLGALASTLIRLSNMYGVLRPEGLHLDIRLTNNELAELIGATRESVNRMLAALKDEEVIKVVRGEIIILKLDELRQHCECPTAPTCAKGVCRL
ncbi:Crp/Fnr family transcriptional regulator [Paenibacillus algorifonticola]|uniref:Crp/Fnr family transcriptional regulator n=1 Tax=Paenibacillus algorifonticola TaxID=684063 RepID=UPI003D2C18D0